MCCVVLAICCRMTKNPNRNLSQVAWDCYHRPCPDQSATAAAAASSSGADAEQSCAGQQQESCPKTSEAVSNDGIQQIIAQAVCSQTVLCRHLKVDNVCLQSGQFVSHSVYCKNNQSTDFSATWHHDWAYQSEERIHFRWWIWSRIWVPDYVSTFLTIVE